MMSLDEEYIRAGRLQISPYAVEGVILYKGEYVPVCPSKEFVEIASLLLPPNMTSIMPEVQAVNLKVRSETDHEFSHVDVSSDYGTLNLLFLSYIPFVPDEKEPDLYGIRDEFYSWNAWELGQAETQLNKHVKDGNLPSDDSVASRMIRNNYRSKALSFFREGNEPW